MQHIPVEVYERIANPFRQEGESIAQFQERLLPAMLVNQAAYNVLHSRVYHEVEVVLTPMTMSPVEQQLRHMRKCQAVMHDLRHLTISGLVRWDHDDSDFHKITVPQLRRILWLAPNLESLTLQNLDVKPAYSRTRALPVLTQPQGPPPNPQGAIRTPPVCNLKLRWVRFLTEATTADFFTLFPGLVKLVQSQVFWTPGFTAADVQAIHASPMRLTLFDVLPTHPNPFPAPASDLRFYPALLSPHVFRNVVRLHLGTNDRLTDYAQQFHLWRSLPLEAAERVRLLGFSLYLTVLHYQGAYTAFSSAVSHLLRKIPGSLKTLEIHLLADHLDDVSAAITIPAHQWDVIRAALDNRASLEAFQVNFIDLKDPPFGDLLDVYSQPLSSTFRWVRLRPAIAYTPFADWEGTTCPDVSPADDE